MSSPCRPDASAETSAALLASQAGTTLTFAPGAPHRDVRLDGVSLDSRRVRPGDLYAALPGANAHGAEFARQAWQAGAVAVLTDPAGEAILREAEIPLPRIVVPDSRAVLGSLSALVYGRPAEDLMLVGITGTNGKTTTAYILDAAWRALGRVTGLIGTIEIKVGERSIPSVRTTPESCDLHAMLAVMREQGVTQAVMEVSSHALALHRVDGVVFDVAIFTNLSQDHLDFHGDMDHYFAAKASLLTPQRSRRGIICVDDAWGERLAAQAQVPCWFLATRPDAAGAQRACWWLRPGPGASFELVGPDATLRLRSSLPGDYNRVNTALAALAVLSTGVEPADVERAVAAGASVPGRMERVDLDSGVAGREPPGVYVDFAHTPEAVRATLTALRTAATGRVVAVIGAGGARDRTKRPLMGAAAARAADLVVVTDDNPRDEDPAAIRADLAAGARHAGGDVVEIAGRSEAIAEALRRSGPGDVVAILGRGHERHQEIAGEYRPLVDRDLVQAAWAAPETWTWTDAGREADR